MKEPIVGIDLGTTNSEVAAFMDGNVRILGKGQNQMLPSCVGLSPDGELLIGQAAANQSLLYPDRTIRSIKRKMGTHEPVMLGDRTYTPEDISALILRELSEWARNALQFDVKQAVITVPAYFSDAQRQATRESGALAGLDVIRLVNEPTAASLAYGQGHQASQTLMVYDLGGGTFDVSIVQIEDQVTEVLASHGNNHLGGDDFDQLILDRLLVAFKTSHGIDLRQAEDRGGYMRLARAAEQAKRNLSSEPVTQIREESVIQVKGAPLHLEQELSRSEYEDMIRPLIESTLESVSKALSDADKSPADIDLILLVGGSSRTPLVSEMLEKRMGAKPRQDVHPDLCVALGAGLLASRSAGHEVEKVLVDVSPYSFGISFLGDRDGMLYPYCYKPIIRRNTPLPVTRTEIYQTSYPYQEKVEMHIFQGENEDAMKNTPVGEFMIEGLEPKPDSNPVLCRMKLDIDGILQVTAIEKETSLSKQVTIEGALKPRTEVQIKAGRRKLAELFARRPDEAFEAFDPEMAERLGLKLAESEDSEDEDYEADPGETGLDSESTDAGSNNESLASIKEGKELVARCRDLLDKLHSEDRFEAADLNEEIEAAIGSKDPQRLQQASEQLKEFLFFVEGR